jgi:photosystem II stability/assembly factor-like uncharacterized protein
MSWKKYGGLNKFEKINNITVSSIVTDTFTVRQSFLNTFNVQGDLRVYGNTYTAGVIVDSGGIINTDYIKVNRAATITEKLYFNSNTNAYMQGLNNNIGINTVAPSSTLDIVAYDSAQTQTLNVRSNNIENRNILARNNANNGIVLYAGSTNYALQFYSGSNITTTTPNAAIQYNSGVLQLTSNTYTHIYNRLAVSKPNRNINAPLLNETAIIYDISSGIYFYDIYAKPLVNTGSALTLVSSDNSSNTFLNIVNPQGNGFRIGGGVYPNDITRNMGVLTLNGYTPSQMIVAGNSSLKNHSTIGFNTYSPKVNNFVVDINGPVHVNNGEITVVSQPSFQINKIRCAKTNPLYGIAVGSSSSISSSSFKVAYTTDGGASWNLSSTTITTPANSLQFTSCYVYDSNKSIIVGQSGFSFYSTNSGSTWSQIALGTSDNFNDIYISQAASNNGFVVYNGGYNYFTMNFSGSPSTTTVSQSGFNIKGVDGYNTTVFLVGGTTIKKLDSTNPSTILSTYNTSSPAASYNAICVFDSSYAVAVGANIISYTTNNGTSWSDIQISDTLTNVNIYNVNYAIAVGNAGVVYISRNSLNWSKIDNNMFDSNGTSSLVLNSTKNLSGVYLSDPNTIIISSITTEFVNGSVLGSSKLFNLFTPYFANNLNNYVFDICGNMRVSGDLYINDYGKLASNNTIFNLLNTGVNTLNVGGNATTISIGASGGIMYNNTSIIFNNRDAKIAVTNIESNPSIPVINIGKLTDTTKIRGTLDVDSATTITGQPILSVLTNPVIYSNTTDCSAIGQGALVVSGGTSIAKNLYVGQEIFTTGIDAIPFTKNSNYLNIGCDSSTNYINIGQNKDTTIINLGNIRNDNIPLPNDGPTTINIGASGDFIYIRGNLILPGNISTFDVSNLRVDDQVIMLNQNARGNGVSRGCGVLIRDNGDNLNAYMICDTNTRGYIFKTASNTNKLDMRTDLITTANLPLSGYNNGLVCVRASQSGLGESDSDYTMFATNAIKTSLKIDDTTPSINTTSGALQVLGGAGISGNVFVGELLNSTNLNITSDASFNSNMYTANRATIDGILNVRNTNESISITSGAVQVLGGAGISGNVFVGKLLNATNLNITSDVSFNSNMYTANRTTIDGILNVRNATESTVANSGALQVLGGAGVSGNVFVGKFLNATNLNITSDASFNSNMYTANRATIDGILNVRNTSESISITSGAVQVLGGAGISGNVFVGKLLNATNLNITSDVSFNSNFYLVGNTITSGNIIINSIAPSYNITTGALQVAGGAGIAGNVFIGKNVNIQGLLTTAALTIDNLWQF